MSTLTLKHIEGWSKDLETLHRRSTVRFARAEPRGRALSYLQGLLSPVKRKNGWHLSEQAGEATPHGTQRLLKAATWDENGVRDDLRDYVLDHLGSDDAVLVIDETGFLKKGEHSVGVKRQSSGTAGRIEHGQVGVFLSDPTAKGTAFIDRELFLPEDWAQDDVRRQAAGVPKAYRFLSKPQLAQQMLRRAFEAGVAPAWVVAETSYASLRTFLEARKQAYVLAVPANFRLRFSNHEGIQQAHIVSLLEALEPRAWQCLSAGQGAKGERLYDWAW